jgi:predicted phosphodiesterase
MFVDKAKIYFNSVGIKRILIAMTGDLLNSDRRLDELLAESTNRSKATFLSVSLLRQMIMDLAQSYAVTIAGVVGNESRITKDVGWVDNVATDNYDYTIFNILRLLFENSGVKFIEGDMIEKVVEVAGQNILLVHGNQIKSTNMEQSIQKIKGKYNARGIHIHFVLSGHLHSCRISDSFARGASLVGANAYSENALQLEGRASQNIHIFYTNGNRDSIKIDLQNTFDIKGYEINSELEAYNAKSLSKAKKKVTIHKIVI